MTTTTTVPIEITCPDWCVDKPEDHAAELWDMGDCMHHMGARKIEDPTGIRRAGVSEPKMCDPIELFMITATNPTGRETESPIVYLEAASDQPIHTIDQMLALADAIREMVEEYRAAGGVA